MNRNLVGSIYERFSIKIDNFVPIRLQTWPPYAILLKNILLWNCLAKEESMESQCSIKIALYRKHMWKVIFAIPHCVPIGQINMVAIGNSCFWLAEI